MRKASSYYRYFGVLMVAILALSACNLPASTAASPSGLDEIGTAAAQTVVAQLTKDAASKPSSPTAPAVATGTAQPNPATNTPQSTQKPENTPGPTANAGTPCDRAEFIGDVTYPDGTTVAPGASFVKTWRLKNNGTCAWNSSYALIFASKDAMGGPSSVSITDGKVAPGAQVDVSVKLKAPDKPGSYEGDWMLRNASGEDFGIGDDAAEPFWVKISVVAGTRISMNPGATSAEVAGHVEKNGRITYLANAGANQFMMVNLKQVNKPLALEIQAPNGLYLIKASEDKDSWQGTLPSDGDYLISIVNSGNATDFNFSLTIPVRVSFKSGATSASVDGVVAARRINTYLLRARKGQTMTVEIDASGGKLFLAISGLDDGKSYVGAETEHTSFTFKLPATQDYVIQCVSTSDLKDEYTVTFTVK